MSSFLENLQFGERYENLFIDKYIDMHVSKLNKPAIECIETHPDSSFKDWDMRATLEDNSVITYEVKSCRNSNSTRNACFEYSFRDRPSSLTATKADYIVYFSVISQMEENCYIIPVSDLLTLLKSKKYREILGGRLKQSKCILVPLSSLEKYLL